MINIVETIKLIRINHWLKNLIIFIPVFFSKELLNFDKLFLLFPYICYFLFILEFGLYF